MPNQLTGFKNKTNGAAACPCVLGGQINIAEALIVKIEYHP